jgi:hypothetical protein
LALAEIVWPLIAPVVVRPPNVGVAAVLMFCMVLMAPLVAVKFVALKLAIPLAAVLALSSVIDEPPADELFIVIGPVSPLSVLTPPEPGQVLNVGEPTVETKHCPALPAATLLSDEVPLPMTTPLAPIVFVPVPPFATDSGLDNVRPANVGLLLTDMFCMVLTTPPETEKFAALKLAIPLATVDALSIVMVVPRPDALAMFKLPDKPLRSLTPDPTPPGQAWKAGAPDVDIRHNPAEAGLTVASGPVPWPITTPLLVSDDTPVPPEETPSGELRRSEEIVVGPSVVVPLTFRFC